MSDLEERVAKLERTNRITALVIIVAICATVFVGFRVERMEKALRRQGLVAEATRQIEMFLANDGESLLSAP